MRIDLSHTLVTEVVEIAMPSGVVRVQVNADVNGLRSDVVQMDANPLAGQTVSGGSGFIKVVRRLNAALTQESPWSYPKNKRWRLWHRPRLS